MLFPHVLPSIVHKKFSNLPQNLFNFNCSSHHFFNINACLYNAQILNFWLQLGNKLAPFFYVLYSSFLKNTYPNVQNIFELAPWALV